MLRKLHIHKLPIWRVSIFTWSAFALAQLMSSYAYGIVTGHPMSFARMVGDVSYNYLFGILLTPPIFMLGLRLPLPRRGWGLRVLQHLAMGTCFCMLHVGWMFMGFSLRVAPAATLARTWTTFWGIVAYAWFYDVLTTYCLIVGVAHLVLYYARLKDQEVRAAQLQASVNLARLKALKSQLHPHFLFNALHTISALMHENVIAADNMLCGLGSLLRRLLQDCELEETSLRHELEFVMRYLEIEQARFGDHLSISTDIPEDILDATVPSLILQPIVENAVVHGISKLRGRGNISIQAQRCGGDLVLAVRDNGPGMSKPPEFGIGLSNVKNRLLSMYGDSSEISISNSGIESGASIRLRLPYRTNEVSGSSEALADESNLALALPE